VVATSALKKKGGSLGHQGRNREIALVKIRNRCRGKKGSLAQNCRKEEQESDSREKEGRSSKRKRRIGPVAGKKAASAPSSVVKEKGKNNWPEYNTKMQPGL